MMIATRHLREVRCPIQWNSVHHLELYQYERQDGAECHMAKRQSDWVRKARERQDVFVDEDDTSTQGDP
jgi:hypothetical protein